jgi:phosphate transport system permease protein
VSTPVGTSAGRAVGTLSRPFRGRRIEGLRVACQVASALTAATLVGLLALLVIQSLPVWRHEGLGGFLLGDVWFYRGGRFGALAMIYGSSVVAGIALLLAVPLGLGAAVFTAEGLSGPLRLAVKGTIELLAGVPSVVYGLLGVLVLRGVVFRLVEPFDPLSGDSLLTAGVLLAVMILPTVTTFADDALRGVAATQRQAARALGLTRTETTLRVVLPQALPGLLAAVLLGLGRALGETIAVFLVVGRMDNRLPESWLDPRPLIEPGQTLTSKLGGSETFLAYGDPLHWAAITGLALVLLLAVAAVTLGGVSLATDRKGERGATLG